MENRVIHGDCYDDLKLVSNESVNLILIDPPYQISRNSNFNKNSSNKKFNKISIDFGDWDHDEIDLDYLFKQFKRILKKGGYLIIFYDIWKSTNLKLYSEINGFKQPRVCQWVKSNPVPINSKVNYLSNAVEYFFTFVKGGKPTFNSEYDKGIYTFPLCHGKERTIHPTQKPLGLIRELIEKHSSENDLVLDCFGGSGTTAIACKSLNRYYYLIEKDLEYFQIIKQRLDST